MERCATLKKIAQFLSSVAFLWVGTTFCCFPQNGFAADRGAAQASGALDLSARTINPFNAGSTATVLIFVAVDCPISNKYAPEIQRLQRLFEKRNIAFWMVYPDGDTPVAEIRQHAREYGLGNKILRDPNHFLVKKAHATITPQAAIFDRNRNLVYLGRIDDRFVALGQERTQATYKDLEENLNCLLEGKPISQKETRSIGCHISGIN